MGILQDKFECITWDTCTNIVAEADRPAPGGFNTENNVYHARTHWDHFFNTAAELVGSEDMTGTVDYAGIEMVHTDQYSLISRIKVSYYDAPEEEHDYVDNWDAIFWPTVEDYQYFTAYDNDDLVDQEVGFAAGELATWFFSDAFDQGLDTSDFGTFFSRDHLVGRDIEVPHLRMCVKDCANYGYGSKIHRDPWLPR